MQYHDLAKKQPFDEDIYTSLKLSFHRHLLAL